MTIIAAMWESDESLLIAADSGQTHTPGDIRSVYLNKLQKHPTAPLAWGAAGNPTIGITRFGDWLSQYNWPSTDWISFQDEIAANLAQLNGKQRELCKFANVEAQSDDLAGVLVVGWLETPRIFEIDDRGVIDEITRDREFHAIGSGGVHARIVQSAFSQVSSNSPVLQKFRDVMEIAARLAPGCSQPIHIWRVSREKIDTA